MIGNFLYNLMSLLTFILMLSMFAKGLKFLLHTYLLLVAYFSFTHFVSVCGVQTIRILNSMCASVPDSIF